MTAKRVMLVEDHETFRVGLRTELAKNPELEVVAEADRVESAIEKALAVRPDVLVLDMDIRGLNEGEDGTTVAAALRRAGAIIPILVVSAFDREMYLLSMLSEGVAGYYLKTEPLSSIITAIHGVASGQSGWFSREVTDILAASMRKGQKMTVRELEILQSLESSNEELAGEFNIKIGTAKKHVGNILAKLGVPSRAAAISLAWQRGLIKRIK